MNIFYLHSDPAEAAKSHIDKHVVKIPLEVAQMACTNLRITNLFGPRPRKLTSDELKLLRNTEDKNLAIEDREIPYLPCHENHPCTVWMRTSFENYAWAINYAFALEEEYKYRYGKPSLKACDVLRKIPDPSFEFYLGETTPAMAMPDKYKSEDPVMSYRNYYLGEKAGIATWKRRSAPDWWINYG